jgi:cyclohexa-1,5-dienecarbonyl-CoA hydratase
MQAVRNSERFILQRIEKPNRKALPVMPHLRMDNIDRSLKFVEILTFPNLSDRSIHLCLRAYFSRWVLLSVGKSFSGATMPEFKKVKLDLTHESQILAVTLNAPKGNVLDREMISELILAVKEHGSAPSPKALVFQGAGEHFSFGASVPEHQKEFVAGMLATFHELFRALIASNKPCLALVRGQCLGGGFELAMFCHWIFAAENAKFGQPEINLAVFPPVASLLLPHRVGQSAADDLVLSGRSITAQEAKQMGLVYSVSADPQIALDEFLAQHLLPKSATALQFAARASRYEMHQAFLRNIGELERMYVQELMVTADANEGIKAFMEKRKPIWKNK